ncbi:pyrroline-5-carboxylate reductase [Seinonella peptonophila]|uniref:Pyrroline-5-carboxylate reductase n=2 Tax=Seinonella peptonophila TaxID=112248 RepID=A0A1M4ZI30_9BACL|nr:pyrroline-5-carboxylate reductase [Seinonella peptonophila]
MLQEKRIGFIGAGAMSEAIIAGLLQTKQVEPKQIFLTNRSDEQRLQDLINQYGLSAKATEIKQIASADIVVLATKPKDVPEAMRYWSKKLCSGQLLISIAAGIEIAYLESFLSTEVAIVRAMPNTSSAVGYSATAMCHGRFASKQDVECALQIFRSIGAVWTVDESLMDAVTGLSGSGPAYIYYVVEALEAAGIQAGLEKQVARELTLQTFFGAAQMLMQSGKEASQLRQEVTSPNGTTMAGLAELNRHETQKVFQQAVLKATERSAEMGKELNKVGT